MTGLQFITVLVLTLSSWGMMCWVMRRLKPSSYLAIALIILSLATMIGAFALGSYWNHDDFTCKPGQHCFPWGD